MRNKNFVKVKVLDQRDDTIRTIYFYEWSEALQYLHDNCNRKTDIVLLLRYTEDTETYSIKRYAKFSRKVA